MQPQFQGPISMQHQGQTPMHMPAPIPRAAPSLPAQALSPHLQFEYPGQIVINGEVFVPVSLLIDALRCQSVKQQLPPLPVVESCAVPVRSVADAGPKPPKVPPQIVTKKAEELARSWVRSMPLTFVPKAAQKRKQEEYDRQRSAMVAPKKRPIKGRSEPSKVDKQVVSVEDEEEGWGDDDDDENWGKDWKHTWTDEPEAEASTDNDARGPKKYKWLKSNNCNTKGCVFSCSLLNSNLTVSCFGVNPL
jgi:hypothetical protein